MRANSNSMLDASCFETDKHLHNPRNNKRKLGCFLKADRGIYLFCSDTLFVSLPIQQMSVSGKSSNLPS